jgi:site-specific DNA recombinase
MTSCNAHLDNSCVASREIAASYSRYSSDMQREESNVDQQRKCRERAEPNRHQILPDLEFSDEAVSGTKLHRAGLDAMLAAAEAGHFKVLYFHSLSRLARESVITMPLLKRIVYNFGIRVISITDGVDSDHDSWELIAAIMSIVHERYVKELAENVFRGQEGAVLDGLCVGDYCFGFTSVAIQGTEQGRGRNGKPRKQYVINEITAPWVIRIFYWFVVERRTLRWIARELNRLGAPKDHRSRTQPWHHRYITELLVNPKYIGEWPWGKRKNTRDPLTGKVTQKIRPPEECEKWLRHFPELRIIDEETFKLAQQLLKNNKAKNAEKRKEKGRLAGSTGQTARLQPRHLLSMLIRCEECGKIFYVGGANGKYLFCPGYHMGTCCCKTQLLRKRAEKMILDEIGRRILVNPNWRQVVLDELSKACKFDEAQLPSALAAAEKALANVERRITNLVAQIEDGHGGPEVGNQLAKRRIERREWEEKVKYLRKADQNRRPAPTDTWVNQQLQHLGDILAQNTPAAAIALRDLVGGEIVVAEIRNPDRQRHYLQGRFTIKATTLVQAISGQNNDSPPNDAELPDDAGEEIIIDFREPAQCEVDSEKAKELYDQGLLMVQIAQKLDCGASHVTKLIKYWFESRGLPVPDSKNRRSTLQHKHQVPPTFKAIADQVLELLNANLLIIEIAERLGVCKDTITKVIKYLRTDRGLSIPDGRARRKTLGRKVSQPQDCSEDQPKSTSDAA